MTDILRMTADIIAAFASKNTASKEDILEMVEEIPKRLTRSEDGRPQMVESTALREQAPAVSKRKAFGKKKVVCMICGKEMRSLGRHLKKAHGLNPDEYRSRFGIPNDQPLVAKELSDLRRQKAVDGWLAMVMKNARAAVRIVKSAD